MSDKSKTLEFIYQDTQIHFLVNPLDKNVMINATEMAKHFDKEVRSFLRLEGTQNFINTLIKKYFDRADLYGQNPEKYIFYTTNKATFMHRKLALKFAAWLDVEFELWIIDTIDNILFGNYNKHMAAHFTREEAKAKMDLLQNELITDFKPHLVKEYFEAKDAFEEAGKEKSRAIRNQLDLFKGLRE